MNKKAAIAKVKRLYGITVVKDITAAWKRAGKPLGKEEFLFFILEALGNLELEGENLGAIITVEPGTYMHPVRQKEVIAHSNPPRKEHYYLKYGIYEQGGNECLEMTDTLYKARQAVFKWYKKFRVAIEARKMYVPKGSPVVWSIQGDDTRSNGKLGEYIIVGFTKWLQ